MGYFIVKNKKGKHSSRSDYRGKFTLEAEGLEVHTHFGREDYANAWAGYYNNEFGQAELRKRLGLTP